MVEDIHWSDPATRDLVTFLVRNLDAERLLLVLTIRTDDVSRSHPAAPWIAELLRAPSAERIDLERLAIDDVRRQVEAITGRPPETSRVRALWRRSDGNPFFVEELLAAGTSVRAPMTPEPPDHGAIPRSLVDVLLGRLLDLPPDVERIVHAVGVAGTPVEEALLERALGVPAAELRSALRAPIDSGLLRIDDAGRVRPRHALLGEAIEASLLAGERRDLHEALARAFESGPPAGGEAGASSRPPAPGTGSRPTGPRRRSPRPSTRPRRRRPCTPTRRRRATCSTRWRSTSGAPSRSRAPTVRRC